MSCYLLLLLFVVVVLVVVVLVILVVFGACFTPLYVDVGYIVCIDKLY